MRAGYNAISGLCPPVLDCNGRISSRRDRRGPSNQVVDRASRVLEYDEFQGLLQHLWLIKPMEVMQMPGPRLSPDDRALIQAGLESRLR